MSTTTITRKELEVPLGALIEVSDILIENGISNEITGTDEDEDTVTLEVSFTKEERDIIHEVENLISDFNPDGEEDDK
ncbi:MAG: hypothetical protein ABIP10_06005 [Ferruginibacter sp.]